MIHPIVKYGEAVLEKIAEPVTVFDQALEKLVEDMFDSMYAAHGVGLAATQIGVPQRVAVVDIGTKEKPFKKLILVNPQIIHKEGKQREKEGCLSLPEFHEPVSRAKKVTVRAQDLTGKFFEETGEGLLARAFLHETDHLDGKLFISHISALKRDLIKRRIKKLASAGEWI